MMAIIGEEGMQQRDGDKDESKSESVSTKAGLLEVAISGSITDPSQFVAGIIEGISGPG
jgi:hypothetical protein